MAKYKLIFNDAIDDYTMAEIRPSSVNRESYIEQTIDIVLEEGSGHNHDCIVFTMDKSTAIKFAKTLRTEINKITESEVNNG